MRMLSDLTTIKVSDMFTKEMLAECGGGGNTKTAYINSDISTELVRRGKNAIPDIAKYLNLCFHEIVKEYDEECVEKVREAWIWLYIDIVHDGAPQSSMPSFNKIKELTSQYKVK